MMMINIVNNNNIKMNNKQNIISIMNMKFKINIINKI